MTASVADILKEAGLVPVVPALSRRAGASEALAGQRVPVVPAVPAAKHKDEGGNGLQAIKAHLIEIADAEGLHADHVHRLTPADLIECRGLPTRTLRAYLHAVKETADRMAGRVPADETAAILCRSCGPVWAHPAIAEALPKVDGWPRALGCPWCHVRAAGRTIPRPPVTCAGCRHFQPDKINPAAGFGSCAAGHAPRFPNEPHRCETFRTASRPAGSNGRASRGGRSAGGHTARL